MWRLRSYGRIKNAVKKYGSGEGLVYVLDHAEFTLDEGEICVILRQHRTIASAALCGYFSTQLRRDFLK